jgi:glycosyltransferase involved in cell wall biosynthesis
MPKISVNIPVFNDEKYIRQTLDSVLGQTFSDLEVVIVDDGSTDGTAAIIKGYRDPRLKYYYQRNQGIGAARNRALKESSGEYIAFLDHDDLWLPAKLEKQMALLEKDSSLGLVFCDTTFFNDRGDMYSIYADRKPPRGRVFDEILSWYFLSCETVVIRQAVLAQVGEFPPQMMMAEEYDLFLRIAYKYPIDYVDEPLAKYRIHEKNYSWGKELQAIEEEAEAVRNLRRRFPEVEQRHAAGLQKKMDELDLRRVLLFWKEGERGEARRLLRKSRVAGLKKLVLLTAITLLPYGLYSRYLKNPFSK